jgi:putative endonuclease
MSEVWSVYLVRRADGALYCGIARDAVRRFAEHEASGPRSAKALRGRGPLRLVWCCTVPDQGTALQIEHRLKRWPKATKEALVSGRAVLPWPESAQD